MAKNYGQKDWRHEYIQPPEDEARAIRVQFMGRLWKILEPLALTERACSWLSMRGFSSELAHALGFRDWRPVMTRLKEILEVLSPPHRVATGFFFKYGSMWWPICDLHRVGLYKRSVATSENMPRYAEGLVAPVWDGRAEHPQGWLWQVYEPIGPSPADNCMRQLSAHQPRLIGLGAGASGLPLPGAHKTLLVGEGPMDYLALSQAADGRAAVLGILRTIHLWRDEWTAYLDGAERVALVLPDRKGYADQVYEAMKKSARKRFGPHWPEGFLDLWIMQGEDDCRKSMQSGELAEMIAGL